MTTEPTIDPRRRAAEALLEFQAASSFGSHDENLVIALRFVDQMVAAVAGSSIPIVTKKQALRSICERQSGPE